MKAYIIHQSELGTDYWGEGMYALVTEKEEIIAKKWCSSRVFANYDLTAWQEDKLKEHGVTDVYSNDKLVWHDGKLAEGVASAFLAEERYYELINRDVI